MITRMSNQPLTAAQKIIVNTVLVTSMMLATSGHSIAATLLVANKSEASVTLFELPSGEAVAELPTGAGPHEVAVSPDGRLAAITNYGTPGTAGESLTLVDIADAAVQKTIDLPPASKPHGIEWLNGERVAVTAEGLDAVLVVNVQSGDIEAQIAVDQRIAHMLTANAERVFTANIGSGSSSVVELSSGEKTVDLQAGAGTEGIALVNGGDELWLSNRAADTVTIFDSHSLVRQDELTVNGFPIRLEPDASRNRVYVTLPAKDSLAVIDSQSRQVTTEFRFDVPPDPTRKTIFGDRLPNSSVPIGVLLSGDAQRLFIAHSAAHKVTIWDADSLTYLGDIDTGLEPDGMDWSAVNVRPQAD